MSSLKINCRNVSWCKCFKDILIFMSADLSPWWKSSHVCTDPQRCLPALLAPYPAAAYSSQQKPHAGPQTMQCTEKERSKKAFSTLCTVPALVLLAFGMRSACSSPLPVALCAHIHPSCAVWGPGEPAQGPFLSGSPRQDPRVGQGSRGRGSLREPLPVPGPPPQTAYARCQSPAGPSLRPGKRDRPALRHATLLR